MTGGEYFDVVFDATGNARAMEASFGFVAHTGTLVFVGVLAADITFSDPELHKREMRLLATRNAVKADFDQVMAAMLAGSHPDPRASTPIRLPSTGCPKRCRRGSRRTRRR